MGEFDLRPPPPLLFSRRTTRLAARDVIKYDLLPKIQTYIVCELARTLTTFPGRSTLLWDGVCRGERNRQRKCLCGTSVCGESGPVDLLVPGGGGKLGDVDSISFFGVCVVVVGINNS